MNYPSINEYKEAILFAEDNFEQLKNLRPVLEDDGSPVMTSGNFAVVFKMKDEQTGKLYAVKCFLREQEGRAEAYRQIAEELEYVSSTFLTPIKYLDKELFVDSSNSEDSEFPVLLMDWVEGQTLDKYIREHIDDQYELSLLAYQFSRLAMWLMPQPFAHGDLKPDNILVKSDGTLVLVDYDGMYVPAMKGQKARELGSPDFRHPGRTEEVFDDHIDDFSLASILLSLKAIALQPSLLEEYGASDRLLFSEKDYRNLSESKVMDALRPLIQDSELATLYSLFILSSAQNNLSQASFRLLNLSRPQPCSNEENGKETSSANTWEGEYVDLGLSIKWATCNIGANKPEEFGDYFKWGYYVPQNKPSLDKSKKSNLSYNNKYNVSDRLKVLNPEDDTATVLLGCPWRMPTIEEFRELKEKCVWKECYLNGVKGCRVTGINGNSIFLPFAGCYDVGFPFKAEEGTYWSSTAYTDNYLTSDNSWLITFKSEHPIINYYFRSCATPIRPVILADENLSAEVTDEDLANAWTDEYGVMYSADKKRLLSLPRETCDPSFRTGGTFYTDITIKDGTKIICDYSFENCRSLESIRIPNSVVRIGKSAFHGCERIKSIIIPNGLKEIGDSAFNGCSNLTSINLPASIIKIGAHLFSGCCNLSSMTVDKDNSTFDSREDCNAIIETRSNTLIYGCALSIITNKISTIGDYAFEGVRLNSIIIPNGVNTIGAFAFSRQVPHSYPLSRLEKLRFGKNSPSHYKKISIPESVSKIGIGAFYGYGDFSIEVDSKNRYYDSRNHCNAIIETKSNTLINGCSSTIIPSGISKIDSYAFCKCIDLKSIRLPQGLEFIGDETFKDCEHLLSIEIPNSVVSIGKGAFWNCEWLQSVSLSNHIKTIDNSLFSGCTRLQSISIPESVSTIGDNAFEYCQDLKNVELPNSIKMIGNSAFEGCNGITSIILPPSVTNIGRYAFCNCCLSSILIPENVKKIELGAFACYGLSSIVVDNRNKFYDSRNNCNAIIETNSNKLITGCSNTEIPDSVLEIGISAFYRCDELTHFTIPINIKKIDEYAFDACTNLETIEFLGILDDIEKPIFDDDCGVPSIIIPEGTRKKYEELLPDYKAKIRERVFIDNHKGLKRTFSKEEIKCVTKAEVVHGQSTKQVCFYLIDGSQKYIPLSKDSKLSIGDEVVLNKANLIEFNDEGICYGYIDGHIYYSKNLVDA